MKVVFAILCCFTLGCALGQSMLEPQNPAPRVGDQLDVTLYFEKENLQWLENKMAKTEAENERLANNRVATGALRLNHVLADTGQITVGPLSLTFQGTTFTTEPLVLTVSPALPKNIGDGIWIRSVQFKGFYYLIIEQRIANQWKKQEDEEAITLSTMDVVFAEIDQEKLEGKGLNIVSNSSSSDNQQVDKSAGFGAGSSAYKITILKYLRTPLFKSFKLDKKFFSNLPKNIVPAEVVIK